MRRPGSPERSPASFYTVHPRDPRPLVCPSVLTTLFVRFTPGILIILFSNCMTALFNPVHRRGEGIKWGLVSYTVVMFSLVTVYTATKGHIFSISYIDNRGFPRGPWGYQADTYLTAIPIVSRAAFNLNNWSADGLLVRPSFDTVVIHSSA